MSMPAAVKRLGRPAATISIPVAGSVTMPLQGLETGRLASTPAGTVKLPALASSEQIKLARTFESVLIDTPAMVMISAAGSAALHVTVRPLARGMDRVASRFVQTNPAGIRRLAMNAGTSTPPLPLFTT